MRIQELELRTGLDRATIRYYEREALITPMRHENGYRDYSDADKENLLKIKLLRQLGLSLEKIRDLQQGRADFSRTMDDQIFILSREITAMERARQICAEIKKEGTDYQTLDADRYLKRLAEPIQKPLPYTFSEPLQRERHPVRRFVARTLDRVLLAAMLEFTLIVIMRIRPADSIPSFVITYGAFWLLIPLEALALHLFGTTLGKRIMGIRLESINGGKLSYCAAIKRAFWAYRLGEGWGIPFWSIWRLYKSYKQHQEDVDMDWEEESEIFYSNWNWRGCLALAAAITLCICLITTTVNDSVLPANREKYLPMEAFVENYTDYAQIFSDTSRFFLSEDGTWAEEAVPSNTVVIDLEPHVRADYTYTIQDNGIHALVYEDTWSDFSMASAFPNYCRYASYAILAAQPGMTAAQLTEFDSVLEEEFINRLMHSSDAASLSGSFTIGEVRFTWEIERENCLTASNLLLRDQDGQPNLYRLLYKIEVLP